MLARYGGLRYAEICSFYSQATFDCQTGLLKLKDRCLFLPLPAVRSLRRILSLPDASAPEFFRLDAGFVRRTFYDLASMAGLAPAACAPRALRYARALELMELRMPPEVVGRLLGIASPEQMMRLVELREPVKRLPNHFTAVITGMETDGRSGRLVLLADVVLVALCSLAELAALEPGIGRTVGAYVPPGLVFPSPVPLPMSNCLPCRLVSVARDSVETRIWLETQNGSRILSLTDTAALDGEGLAPGSQVTACIPGHAIRLEPAGSAANL